MTFSLPEARRWVTSHIEGNKDLRKKTQESDNKLDGYYL